LESWEVHVWSVTLAEGEASDTRFDDILSADERRAIRRLRFAGDRRRRRASHVAARWILGRYLGIAPERIRFERNASGKPTLPDTDIEFSISHSGDLALVGVGRGRPLGIDVERVHGIPDWNALADFILTGRERGIVMPDDPAGLLQVWTRKEALLKAIGTGLVDSPTELDVMESSRVAGLVITDLELPPGYVGAVAVRDDFVRLATCSFDWTLC
jgi:4'-phosphopantetheinyl transferase